MGLFGKLKENMNHGGVKVQIQAPSSIPGNQVIPVTVTITADSAQTINSVKAEIRAQAREQGVNFGGGNMGRGGIGVQQGRTTTETIAQVESREPFTISPGDTKTVSLQLFINGNTGGANPMGQAGDMSSGVGGALQALVSVAQNFEHINYIYTVHASADVQGVTMDPSDKLPIQILPAAAAAPAPAAPPVQSPAQPAPPMPIMPAAIVPPPAAESNPDQRS